MPHPHHQDRSFLALLLSLALHGLTVLILISLPQGQEGPMLKPETQVEFEWREPSETSGPKTIVADTQPPPEVELDDKDLAEALLKEVRRLSRQTRRVREELIQAGPLESPQSSPSSSSESKTGFSGSGVFKPQVADFIPGVRQGHFTALNSDQFSYYSFFRRINEQILNRWVPQLRLATAQLGPELTRSSLLRELSSVIEVILSPEGAIEEITLQKSSGYRSIDLAAIHALHNSAPFNNPPQEMVKEDGYIRLKYQFVLILSPVFASAP